MNERPLILLTNDDGVYAKGLKEVTEVMRLFGDIVVVAPDSPRSGMSHAITVDRPLRVNKLEEEDGLTIYSCTGTPVDCVKLACNQLLDRLPDFVISGINTVPTARFPFSIPEPWGGLSRGAFMEFHLSAFP